MRLLELFSGTGSVGRSFAKLGWEVVSLDISPTHHPTHCCDILTWDCQYPPGHFDCVHASCPCEQYSRARTTGKMPRNLALADSLVARTRELIEHLKPTYWIVENPATSLLSTREVMADLAPYRKVTTYCRYGTPYRKATAFWTNLPWEPRPPCCKASPCGQMVDGRHPSTAQRGPGRCKEGRLQGDVCSLDQLHSIPEALCDELASTAHHNCSTDE